MANEGRNPTYSKSDTLGFMIALELDEHMALIPEPYNPEMKAHTSRKVIFFYNCLKCSNIPSQNLERFIVALLLTFYWAEGREK